VFNSGPLFSFILYLQLNLLTVPEQTRSPFYPSTFPQEAAISLQRDQTEVICGIFAKIFLSNKSNTFPPSLTHPGIEYREIEYLTNSAITKLQLPAPNDQY
jgi:hypothetical protein